VQRKRVRRAIWDNVHPNEGVAFGPFQSEIQTGECSLPSVEIVTQIRHHCYGTLPAAFLLRIPFQQTWRNEVVVRLVLLSRSVTDHRRTLMANGGEAGESSGPLFKDRAYKIAALRI